MSSEAFWILVVVGCAAAVLLALFIALLLRLASRFDPQAAPDWLETFSLERYAPMERLLDASDFEFVAARSPGQPKLRKQLLAARRDIFREYLDLLVEDFNQLHAIAKRMLIHAPEDRPEFAGQLLRQQVRFYWAVCVIRLKVALYPYGWTAIAVPNLLGALERMHREIQAGATRSLPHAGA